jgi:hypothetical protein
MSNMSAMDLVDDVREILMRARMGKGDERGYLTAYQILAAFPAALRSTLIEQRGLPGKGAGVHYSAASLVAEAAKNVPCIQVAYFDPRHIEFHIDDHVVGAGYEVCGLYRLL